MPYVHVSTQVRLESGPCIVGDIYSDPQLMSVLDARKITRLGNNFEEWVTDLLPRLVLDRLEVHGYAVVGLTGVGQTCIWCLYKPGVTTPTPEKNGNQPYINNSALDQDDLAYSDV